MATEGGHEGGSGFNIHPMDQFQVRPLFGGAEVHWYTPTNATLWMLLAVGAIALLMAVGARGRQLVPSRAQSAAEVTYGFVRRMVEDIAGKGAKQLTCDQIALEQAGPYAAEEADVTLRLHQ